MLSQKPIRIPSKKIRLKVVIHWTREKAIHASITGHRSDAIWIPKSLVDVELKGFDTWITIDRKIAIQKGLIDE